jgi:hypothetical protein
MKLKLDRLTILSLLAILLLGSCGETNGGLKTSPPNLQTTTPSVSPNLDRGLATVPIPTKCKGAGNKNCDRLGYIEKTGKLVFEF